MVTQKVGNIILSPTNLHKIVRFFNIGREDNDFTLNHISEKIHNRKNIISLTIHLGLTTISLCLCKMSRNKNDFYFTST